MLEFIFQCNIWDDIRKEYLCLKYAKCTWPPPLLPLSHFNIKGNFKYHDFIESGIEITDVSLLLLLF